MGKVIGLYIAPDKGAPMQTVREVRAVHGLGLEGDRHYYGRGTMFGPADKPRDVTIASAADTLKANQWLAERGFATYTPEQLRRNIVIDDAGDMARYLEQDFAIAGIPMRGIEFAQPCKRPPRLIGREHEIVFKEAFMHRAGIRAQFLSDGPIELGDIMAFLPVLA